MAQARFKAKGIKMEKTFEQIEQIYADKWIGGYSIGVIGGRVYKFIDREIARLNSMAMELPSETQKFCQQKIFVKRLIYHALHDQKFLVGLNKERFCEFIRWCATFNPVLPSEVLCKLSETFTGEYWNL